MENFTDYQALCGQIRALTEGVPHVISNLANVSALLWQALPEINWVGFYHLEGEKLILYPFQGKPACIEIPLGRGVCGRAAAEDRVYRVEDVHAFPGHIACDSASNSEIVIPLHAGGTIWGVLDIDSPTTARFTERDSAGLKAVAAVLEEIL